HQLSLLPPHPISPLFPYTTLFRSESRDILQKRYAQSSAQFGEDVPRPPHWGGYRIRPNMIEFWQGRDNRLHDRLRYSLQNDGSRSEEHTSELQSPDHLVCRLLLEK